MIFNRFQKTQVKLPPPQKPVMRSTTAEKASVSSADVENPLKPDAGDRWEKFVQEPLASKSLSAIPGLGPAFTDAFITYNRYQMNQQYTKVCL